MAIEAFAKRAGFEIVETFYDEAVIGRPGFTASLKRLESDGVRTIIVETADG